MTSKLQMNCPSLQNKITQLETLLSKTETQEQNTMLIRLVIHGAANSIDILQDKL
jgi:hypothetical protein